MPNRSPPRRPLAVWCLVLLALLGALLGAYAPVVSHAIARAQGPAGAEWRLDICSSVQSPHGAQAPVADGAPSDNHKSPLSPAHCLLCLHAADRGAPPRHALQPAMVLPGTLPSPVAQPVFFYAMASVRLPPPRGPPSSVTTA